MMRSRVLVLMTGVPLMLCDYAKASSGGDACLCFIAHVLHSRVPDVVMS